MRWALKYGISVIVHCLCWFGQLWFEANYAQEINEFLGPNSRISSMISWLLENPEYIWPSLFFITGVLILGIGIKNSKKQKDVQNHPMPPAEDKPKSVELSLPIANEVKPDWPAWNAIDWILTQTDYGKSKFWAEIEWDLTEAMRDYRITLWARNTQGGKYYNLTSNSKYVRQMFPDTGPEDMLLHIPKQNPPGVVKSGSCRNVDNYDPLVSSKEIANEFGSRLEQQIITHDWPAIYVAKYIRDETEIGERCTLRDIESKLTQVAADGDLQVWAKKSRDAVYTKIDRKVFGDNVFRLSDNALEGTICSPDTDDFMLGLGGSGMYMPMLFRVEVKKLFPPKTKKSTPET